MANPITHSTTDISRRSVLLQGALCTAGAATIFVANIEPAQAAKLPHASVAYRPTPNGNKECSNCNFFMPPRACQKVAGTISPKGYCILWQET